MVLNMIRVGLVGKNSLFLQGLRHLLDPSRFSIAGEARDVASWQAVHEGDLVAGLTPDLLLADLNGCTDRDVDGLRAVRAAFEHLRIVVLANELCLMDLARLLKAGIDGYLLEDLSAEALSLSLLLVMKGEKALPSTLAGVLARRADSPLPSECLQQQAHRPRPQYLGRNRQGAPEEPDEEDCRRQPDPSGVMGPQQRHRQWRDDRWLALGGRPQA
jgi:DNA-binding NarL/FixJ family response regulator